MLDLDVRSCSSVIAYISVALAVSEVFPSSRHMFDEIQTQQRGFTQKINRQIQCVACKVCKQEKTDLQPLPHNTQPHLTNPTSPRHVATSSNPQAYTKPGDLICMSSDDCSVAVLATWFQMTQPAAIPNQQPYPTSDRAKTHTLYGRHGSPYQPKTLRQL